MIDRQVNYRFIRNPLIRQEPHFGSTFADSSGLHNVISNAMQQAVMEKRGAASDLDLLSEMVRWDAGIGSRILRRLNVTRVRIDEATARLGLKPNTIPLDLEKGARSTHFTDQLKALLDDPGIDQASKDEIMRRGRMMMEVAQERKARRGRQYRLRSSQSGFSV